MSDPSKTLDALQSLVAGSRSADLAPTLSGKEEAFRSLRVACEAAEALVATPHGARLDHLRRVEARGPGPKVVELGRYCVELIHHASLDPPERIRIWRKGHLLAEVEVPDES